MLKWSPIGYMYDQWAGLHQEGSQYPCVNRGFGFIGNIPADWDFLGDYIVCVGVGNAFDVMGESNSHIRNTGIIRVTNSDAWNID